MKTLLGIILLFFLITTAETYAQPPMPGTDGHSILPREQLSTGINMVIEGDYEAAWKYAEHQISVDSLSGHFLAVSILFSRMIELETAEGRNKFYKTVDTLVERAKKRIAGQPDDSEAYFYLGAALGYRGVIRRREGSLWGALRDAHAAKKNLLKALDAAPDFEEPHLFLGSYRYWISAGNVFRFLPFIADNRDAGIRQIEEHLNPESMSYGMSLNNLVWIYLNYKRPEQAQEIARKGLELYPDSRFFLYPAAVTAQRLRQWRKSADLFRKIKESLESDGLHNRYMWLKVTVKQAESLIKIGDNASALALSREALDAQLLPVDTKKSRNLLKRVREIVDFCTRELQN